MPISFNLRLCVPFKMNVSLGEVVYLVIYTFGFPDLFLGANFYRGEDKFGEHEITVF